MLSADSRFAFLLPRSRAGYSLPLPSTALILRSLELTPQGHLSGGWPGWQQRPPFSFL